MTAAHTEDTAQALEEVLQQEEDARASLEAILAKLQGIEEELSAVHDGLPVLEEELSLADLDRDPPPALEIRAVVRGALGDLRSVRQALRDAVEYQPDPCREPALAFDNPAPTAMDGPPDLDRVDAATHRRLYDHVVQQVFTAKQLEPAGDVWVPRYTPQQAGLKVFFLYGRWLATWLPLETPRDLPASERRELVRFVIDPRAPGGISLEDV